MRLISISLRAFVGFVLLVVGGSSNNLAILMLGVGIMFAPIIDLIEELTIAKIEEIDHRQRFREVNK